MGLYEYRCVDCGYLHTALFSYDKKPPAIVCPKCGDLAEPVISAPKFTINGASYANGYQGKSNVRWLDLERKR